MPCFIKLTKAGGKREIWVNMAFVTDMRPGKGATFLARVDGPPYFVIQTPEEIDHLIARSYAERVAAREF